uniref:Uncharacterized protein n=1 Tax=Geospiza parvula TaxID=87175 RepID=A0A8C3M8L6_GEOPR
LSEFRFCGDTSLISNFLQKIRSLEPSPLVSFSSFLISLRAVLQVWTLNRGCLSLLIFLPLNHSMSYMLW